MAVSRLAEIHAWDAGHYSLALPNPPFARRVRLPARLGGMRDERSH